MSETIEIPKTKRVYKKKVAITPEPVVESVAITPEPVVEPVTIPEPPIFTRATNEPTTPKEKKPRSQKQIDAFNRMREAKQKKKQELQTLLPSVVGGLNPHPEPEPEPEPIIQIQESTNKPKKTYKKKEPQQVYIDARTINTVKPETYNEPPIYTQQVPQRIQEKTYKPYIFV